MKRVFLFLAVFSFLVFSVKAQQILKDEIYGTVVAYNHGVQFVTFAPGRQTLIVKIKESKNKNIENQFIIIDYSSYAEKPLPKKMLAGKGVWLFKVTRNVMLAKHLDRTIKDNSIRVINEKTGAEISRINELKWVIKLENQIPADKVLLAFQLSDYKRID